ncbi:hypothetical protein Tco_0294092 [Tanacetum coccineum]
MSMMGELKFFLGLQVHQSPRGIFIRGLMYLTASHPDIAFATFVCARYQARPTVKHLKEMRTMLDGKMIVSKKKQSRRIAISRWKARELEFKNKMVSKNHQALRHGSSATMANRYARYFPIAGTKRVIVGINRRCRYAMMYCFVNNIHVDYVELLRDGTLLFSSYPYIFVFVSRFTKGSSLVITYYLPEIQGRGGHKDKVACNSRWMITDGDEQRHNYRKYAEVFGLRVSSDSVTNRLSLPKEHIGHLAPLALGFEGLKRLMKGSENVIDDSLPPRNDEPKILGTRLEPRSDKESPEVEITNDEEVEITNVVIHVNVNEEEEEITDEVYELKRREKGKIVEESRISDSPTPKIFLSRKSFDTLADHLQEVMVESLPTMVDTHIKEQVKNQVPEQVRDQVPVYVAEGLIMKRQKTKEEMEQMIAKAILQERGNIQAEISSQNSDKN